MGLGLDFPEARVSTEKPFPHDDNAERVVLGAALLSEAAFESASQLATGDFYREAHRSIFEAMGALAFVGRPIDLVSLKDQLARSRHLEAVGGPAYVGALVDGVPRMSNVDHWVRIVQNHARLRGLIHLGNRLAASAQAGESEPGELVDDAVSALLAQADKGSGWCDNPQLVKAAVREIEEQAAATDGILGLRTGLLDLDRALQGIRPGTLGLIGGRLKQGKSVLALQIAEEVAREAEGRVVFFSLEMRAVALMKRRLSAEAMVSINRLHRADPDANAVRWERLNRAAAYCMKPELMINTGCRTVAQMRAAAREVQTKHGLALIVVDYLQLVTPSRRRERRDLEYADISAELLALAHALNAPVIAAAQLNRESEARPDHRPTMADLAGSDTLGRDCDWCVLIQRDLKPPKGETAESYRNLADLWLAAHREGAGARARVRWNNVLARFENLAREGEEQGAA